MPSLALSQHPPAPGTMEQPPRKADKPLIERPILVRAWLFLGMIVSGLAFVGFFYVLLVAGWRTGAATGQGHPLHHAYLQASTMYWVGMMAGQIGTAFAVRTRRAPLSSIGAFSNRYLLAAIAGAIVFAGLFVLRPAVPDAARHCLAPAALPGAAASVSVHRPRRRRAL